MYHDTYSQEEIALIEASGITLEELDAFWQKYPDQNLDTAIGGCVMLKKQQAEETKEVVAEEPTVVSEEEVPPVEAEV